MLARRAVNLAQCAYECTNALIETGQLKDRIVETDLQPVWVNGDPDRLAQILANLTGNAVKYTGAAQMWKGEYLNEKPHMVLSLRYNLISCLPVGHHDANRLQN